MGGGLESRCVGRVCGADGAVLCDSTARHHNVDDGHEFEDNFSEKKGVRQI
jgi:hypothetical protein